MQICRETAQLEYYVLMSNDQMQLSYVLKKTLGPHISPRVYSFRLQLTRILSNKKKQLNFLVCTGTKNQKICTFKVLVIRSVYFFSFFLLLREYITQIKPKVDFYGSFYTWLLPCRFIFRFVRDTCYRKASWIVYSQTALVNIKKQNKFHDFYLKIFYMAAINIEK